MAGRNKNITARLMEQEVGYVSNGGGAGRRGAARGCSQLSVVFVFITLPVWIHAEVRL